MHTAATGERANAYYHWMVSKPHAELYENQDRGSALKAQENSSH
jgi:hypothetical protein